MNDESRLQTEADLQAAMSAYTPHELEELKQTAAHARNQRLSRQNQAETARREPGQPASD